MNPSTTALTLNLQLPNIATVSWAVQGDTLSREITATLLDGSTAWTPQAGYHGVVRAHKPDGTSCVYDVDEDGNPAVTWTGNVATVKIVQQALTVAGTVLMQLEFYDTNDARVSAFGWANNVQPSAVTDNEFLSSDYYNILSLQIAGVLGASSHPPYINSTSKNWMLWDENAAAYVDSGYSSVGTPGPAPAVTSTAYEYANSSSGTIVPSSWSGTRPATSPGTWAWTKTTLTFDNDSTTALYTCAYQGINGDGAVASVNSQTPDQNGNVVVAAGDILTTGGDSVQDDLDDLNAFVTATHTIHVNADGTGDYTTIAAAVSAASDNDIIIVHPATYTETVHATGKKVHIKGVDKKTCILQYSGLDYANPPLEMAKGSVENLTINCLNSGTQGTIPAYCVHIDNDNEAGQSLLFRNVRFYNPVHQAVGIGLRHNFDLAFECCEFEASGQAAFYCHDWETADSGADKTGQKVTLLNCTLRNNSSSHATIMLQSQEIATNCATCKFVGCAVYNDYTYGPTISMTLWQGRTLTNASFMGSSDWVLAGESSLNTDVLINSAKNYVIEQYTFEVSGGIAAGTVGRRAAQVTTSDRHPNMSITGIQIVSIQSSADYNPLVFYTGGLFYCNYYAASGSATSFTTVVARVTYM